jgi:hypothetical protein
MEIRNEFSSIYFKDTLARCGIFIFDHHHASTLRSQQTISLQTSLSQQHPTLQLPQCHEPIRSIRQLENILKQHQSRLEQFIQSMNFYLSNLMNLKVSLINFEGSQLTNNNLYHQNETLLRLLMRLESIQQPLVRLLIETMISVSSLTYETIRDEDESSIMSHHRQHQGGRGGAEESIHFQLQILNHIRWCDVIFDSSLVVTSLLESVQVKLFSIFISLVLIYSMIDLTERITN